MSFHISAKQLIDLGLVSTSETTEKGQYIIIYPQRYLPFWRDRLKSFPDNAACKEFGRKTRNIAEINVLVFHILYSFPVSL